MYIWVILATFIAMLAAFNLPVREDMRALTVEPLAEAYVSKLVTKHRAALMFADNRIPPRNESDRQTLCGSGTTGCDIVDVEYLPYAPFGFYDDPNYQSRVFCLKKGDPDVLEDCDTSGSRFLVTYGPVPRKWRSITDGRPSVDLVNAMNRTVNMGTRFGYAMEVAQVEEETGVTMENNYYGAVMMVRGREPEGAFIPNAIAADADFQSQCVENYCLMYMSEIGS